MSKMISKFSVAIVLFLFAAVTLHAKNISAYYDAAYASDKKVKANLEKAGFEVLATYSPAKKAYLKVIVFTNKQLTAMASKKRRGFAAIQKVMVNSKAKTVRVTNPEYWLKAFLQEEFKAGSSKEIEISIAKALGELTATKDVLDETKISQYHFMLSMPYYGDMLELKKGKGLADKIKKKSLFKLTLANGSTLVGIKMSKSTEKFIETIGEENALVLPYTILVEDDVAYALHAKYYLAVSYPLLSMGQFMKISGAPDAIERKLKKSFK